MKTAQAGLALLFAVVVLVVGLLLYPRRGDGPLLPAPGDPALDSAERREGAVAEWSDPLEGRLGAGLNAPGGSAERDLLILHELLAAWRSNAQGDGNPVGTNREITATLTGRNPWKFEVIPPDHPAINARGELCDRWGTPLFFHQLSAERMELRSSGPDGERYTPDDVVLTP